MINFLWKEGSISRGRKQRVEKKEIAGGKERNCEGEKGENSGWNIVFHLPY